MEGYSGLALRLGAYYRWAYRDSEGRASPVTPISTVILHGLLDRWVARHTACTVYIAYRSSGFFISASVFYVLNLISPVPDMDQMDDVDLYGTFTEAEAKRVGVAALDENMIHGVGGQISEDEIVVYGGQEKGV